MPLLPPLRTRTALRWLSLFARRRYRAIFIATAVLLVVSLALASRLRFDTDFTSLLPRNDPVVETFLATLDDFQSADYLLVAVRLPEDAVLDPYEAFVDALGERLTEMPEFESVEYRLAASEALLRELYPKAVLFLDAEGRAALERRLADEGIRERAREVRRLVATPQGQAAKPLLSLDPFGLADLFLEQVQSSRGALSVDWTSGYYLSRDRRMLLLLAKAVRPPSDIDFANRMADTVELMVEELKGDWPEMVGGGGLGGAIPPPPEVALGGSHMTAVDDARFIRRDAIVGGVVSLIGVLLLFLFAFRRLGPLLFATVPLVTGLILTFALAQLTFGTLSSATSGTAALLIGLGIDFVIVSYGRYVDERRRGASLEAALEAMSGSSGRAVVIGALTTTATFYAFLVTDFTGLRQMGFLTGTGILLCMVSVLLLLPALIAWRHDRHRLRQTTPNHFLHSFGTRALLGACMDRPRTVLAAGALVTVLAALVLPRLYFEESMQTMRPPGNRGIQVTREIGDRFGSGFNYMMMVLTGDTPAEAIALADRAAEGARRMVDDGVLHGFGGVTSLIPPPAQQAAVLDWLERQRAGALGFERIEGTFRRELTAEGLRFEAFAEGLALLEEALGHDRPLGVGDYLGSPETEALLERFIKPTNGGWKSVVYLYPPENHYRREPPPQAVALADELGPGAALTGTNVLNQHVRARVLPDAWLAGALGLLLVAVLLWIDFRTVRHTLLSLTPLAVGIVWMLAAMAGLGIPLNFMNIFVTTMIIGIGVDYGLHVLHRYREARDQGEAELRRALVETGNAIVVAALSTICGFGSLAFSHYPALRSMGYVAILGAAATALVAISLLPAFLAFIRGRGNSGRPAA
jgi:hypothetical protein